MADTYNKVARTGKSLAIRNHMALQVVRYPFHMPSVLFSAVRRYVIALFFLSAATAKADPIPESAKRIRGQVTSLQGAPMAGVEVRAQDGGSQLLGSSKTDAQGTFQIPLPQPASDVTLVVEASGYRRFARSGFVPDGQSKSIQLGRTIDAHYLSSLLKETDPNRFHAQAADLLNPAPGTTGEGRPQEILLPFLTPLCARLRPLVSGKESQLKERTLAAEPSAVMQILAYCSEPVDDSLIDAWRTGSGSFAARPKIPCQSETLDGAIQKWQALHLQNEGIRPGAEPPMQIRKQTSPSNDRALVSVSVEYAHWGYRNTLVLVRKKNLWVVRLVLSDEIWHGT